MSIKRLTIKGLRGFSEEQEISFALPDGKNVGSGLTLLVGPNNGGKSTIIEAIHLLSSSTNIVPETARNKIDDKIRICAIDKNNNNYILESTNNNGAFVKKSYNNGENVLKTFVLSSKRGISSTFFNNSQERNYYKGNMGDQEYRGGEALNNNFGSRLIKIYENRRKFDDYLNRILNPIPNWTIDSTGNNNMYLKFNFGNISHGSVGAGDGYINIYNIIDALYDSSKDDVILIDEPEVSLHPQLQRNLLDLFIECSKDRQIIVATHSPYFINWEILSKKAKIMRVVKKENSAKIYELKEKSKNDITKLINDSQHPYLMTLDTNDIFFLQDNVILTEGQEDVYCYKRVFGHKNFKPNASFFGWGAGGYNKMPYVLNILKDLGYKKVMIIIDKDMEKKKKNLEETYKGYKVFVIEANDVRDKKRDRRAEKILSKIRELDISENVKQEIEEEIKKQFKEKKGLLENKNDLNVKDEYQDCIERLINEMKEYFSFNEPNKLCDDGNNKDDNINNKNEQMEAERLMDNYILDNKLEDKIDEEYNYIEFNAGDSNPISVKKDKSGIYYGVVEVLREITPHQKLIRNYYFYIDLKNNNVELIKYENVINTLPKNILR